MTNFDLVKFCKLAKDKPVKYMWGDWGRPISTKTIIEKARQYPAHYTASYQNELAATISKGGIGCDCTGLIKWFLWSDGNIEQVPKYDGDTDNAASSWYKRAKVRGEIDTIPLDGIGLIVSFSGHCGVYIGNGQVIECTKGQFGNGVVQTALKDRQWEKWCECINITYESEKPTEGQETASTDKYAKVVINCPTYSTLNRKQRIGEVYKGMTVKYLGDYGTLGIIIYPILTSEKIGFVDKENLSF